MTELGFIIVVVGLIVAIMIDKKKMLKTGDKLVQLRTTLDSGGTYDELYAAYEEIRSMQGSVLDYHHQIILNKLEADAKFLLTEIREQI